MCSDCLSWQKLYLDTEPWHVLLLIFSVSLISTQVSHGGDIEVFTGSQNDMNFIIIMSTSLTANSILGARSVLEISGNYFLVFLFQQAGCLTGHFTSLILTRYNKLVYETCLKNWQVKYINLSALLFEWTVNRERQLLTLWVLLPTSLMQTTFHTAKPSWCKTKWNCCVCVMSWNEKCSTTAWQLCKNT